MRCQPRALGPGSLAPSQGPGIEGVPAYVDMIESALAIVSTLDHCNVLAPGDGLSC